MPREGQSGLAIPVPEADPLLTVVAGRVPEAARTDVPAHVSVLHPFLPADELDDRVISVLAELFAAQPVMAVKFAECRRRGEFVYLHPDPVDGLDEVTTRVRRLWPHVVPYEGLYGEVEPHLTVALHTTQQQAEEIEREIVPELLPISAELREARLVIFDGQWTLRERFPFGG